MIFSNVFVFTIYNVSLKLRNILKAISGSEEHRAHFSGLNPGLANLAIALLCMKASLAHFKLFHFKSRRPAPIRTGFMKTKANSAQFTWGLG